jgi:DEAD/DEAH box helicase domain-containing protein
MPDKSPRDIVYFDLETKRTLGDVGGSANKWKMGMSIGVTYSTRSGEYRIYAEKDAEAMAAQLMRADLVVGYNHVGFDYGVLQNYVIPDLLSQTVNLDMLLEIEKLVGRRLKLDDVATATLGLGKSGDGLQAILWFREGKFREIAEYCAYDVKVTMRVHEYGVRNGHVKYRDQSGAVQTVPVDW